MVTSVWLSMVSMPQFSSSLSTSWPSRDGHFSRAVAEGGLGNRSGTRPDSLNDHNSQKSIGLSRMDRLSDTPRMLLFWGALPTLS